MGNDTTTYHIELVPDKNHNGVLGIKIPKCPKYGESGHCGGSANCRGEYERYIPLDEIIKLKNKHIGFGCSDRFTMDFDGSKQEVYIKPTDNYFEIVPSNWVERLLGLDKTPGILTGEPQDRIRVKAIITL